MEYIVEPGVLEVQGEGKAGYLELGEWRRRHRMGGVAARGRLGGDTSEDSVGRSVRSKR